jgi:hypothetical protein
MALSCASNAELAANNSRIGIKDATWTMNGFARVDGICINNTWIFNSAGL